MRVAVRRNATSAGLVRWTVTRTQRHHALLVLRDSIGLSQWASTAPARALIVLMDVRISIWTVRQDARYATLDRMLTKHPRCALSARRVRLIKMTTRARHVPRV